MPFAEVLLIIESYNFWYEKMQKQLEKKAQEEKKKEWKPSSQFEAFMQRLKALQQQKQNNEKS